MGRLRIPLHVKVMISYVLVVTLVLVPILIYLQGNLEAELEQAALEEMTTEALILADRLGGAPNESELVAELIAGAISNRITIIARSGEVLGDSVVGASKLDNHGDRPEVQQALETGVGHAIRGSASTKEKRIYAAARFPKNGTPRGVVRLSKRSRDVQAVTHRALAFLKQASALGLTAALILSLIAAMVVSVPLRRITTAARAFAAGDFGHQVNVHTRDELGTAADALRDLAEQLRDTLVATGSAQATLTAILDHLPCGLILLDQNGRARHASGMARRLCELAGPDEAERTNELLSLPDQIEANRRAKESGKSVSTSLTLPWARERRLESRWVNIYSESGDRSAAVIIVDRNDQDAYANITRSLNGTVFLMVEAAKAMGDSSLKVSLENEVQRLDQWASWHLPEEQDARAVSIADLCQLAAEQIEGHAELKKVKLKFELQESGALVHESHGRSCRALRRFLELAVSTAKKGSNVSVSGAVQDGTVKLSVKTKETEIDLDPLEKLAAKAGGKAGTKKVGDALFAWITIPRA